MTDARRRLADQLRDLSLREGTFTLTSGKTASVYIDVRKTALTGRGARAIGEHLWGLVQTHCPTARAIGGMTLGADPLVTAVAIAAFDAGADFDAIIVRKEPKGHGLGKYLVLPDHLGEGDEVVAVDDTMTTGGSTVDAIERLRDAGFVVRHALCVVDREAGARERLADAGVALHSLFTLSELTDRGGSK